MVIRNQKVCSQNPPTHLLIFYLKTKQKHCNAMLFRSWRFICLICNFCSSWGCHMASSRDSFCLFVFLSWKSIFYCAIRTFSEVFFDKNFIAFFLSSFGCWFFLKPNTEEFFLFLSSLWHHPKSVVEPSKNFPYYFGLITSLFWIKL